MKRRNLLTAFAWGAASLALAAPLAQTAQAADAPGVAFVYLGNPGDAGWTYARTMASSRCDSPFPPLPRDEPLPVRTALKETMPRLLAWPGSSLPAR